MDPPSGAPPSLDPCPSQVPISQSDNAELLGIDPPFLSSHRTKSSRDPLHPRTTAVPIQPVPDFPAAKQPRDASSAHSAPDTRPFAEKSQRNTTPSPAKKSHHSTVGDSRASMQNKSMQSNRPSSQSRAVQWVRVTPQTQAAQKSSNQGTEETGDTGKQGSKECAGTASLSAEVLEKQAAEEIKVLDECLVGSSSEGLESKSVEPPPSGITSHHSDAAPPLANENALQQAVEDLKISDVNQQAAEDPETLCEDHQAAEGQEITRSVAHQAEEQSIPSSTSTAVGEDEQTNEPQQKSLSRSSSSLSARAREFVPKSASVPSAPPAMPSQMHNSVLPPLMIPLNSAPGILSMFPPSSPLPSPQLGGFPLPMVGPPPPPIPASLMGPMPLLGSPHPHPGLLNVQLPGPPPPPVIPQPAYMIHSPSSTVPQHLPSVAPMEPILNPAVKPNAEEAQDQLQSQDSDPASVHPGVTKPVMTEELKEKIVKQVEFYFSDANLPTDYHLMKFVKKDPEGFVPVAIVANFRKVRSLMKNYALVAAALRSSKQLVVSQDGKKVRRLHPLPPHVDLEEIQSRTVVAENLPSDHSIEAMEQLFGNVGNVKMVRICEPEATNGSSQTAKFSKADMVVSNKLHALVEFETVEQAERAVFELTDQRNWRSGLHVRLLLRRTNKHSAAKSHKLNEGADGSAAEDDAMPSSSDSFTERVGDDGNPQERSDEPLGNDSSQLDGASKKGRGRGRGRSGRGRGQYHPNGGRGHPVGTPPQANSLANIEVKPPLGPRMPDGTRGFTLGRGKVMTTNSV